MRKCVSVSMAAAASAALGVAACSAPDRPREPAAALRPLSAHAAPMVTSPAVPVASGTVKAQSGRKRGALGQKTPHPAHGARAAGASPGLIPSGTTAVVPQAARGRAAAAGPAAAGGQAAAPAMAPAQPRPAPPPPTQNQHGQDANIGYDPNAASTAQIVGAVAAARADGKAVLLEFSGNSCSACRALDKAMHTPKVQAVLARSYHVVPIDLDSGDAQHLQMASQYAPLAALGMPLLVVLNPDGTPRAYWALNGQPKYTEADLAAWLTQWGPR